jgi:hypothetical protein
MVYRVVRLGNGVEGMKSSRTEAILYPKARDAKESDRVIAEIPTPSRNYKVVIIRS